MVFWRHFLQKGKVEKCNSHNFLQFQSDMNIEIPRLLFCSLTYAHSSVVVVFAANKIQPSFITFLSGKMLCEEIPFFNIIIFLLQRIMECEKDVDDEVKEEGLSEQYMMIRWCHNAMMWSVTQTSNFHSSMEIISRWLIFYNIFELLLKLLVFIFIGFTFKIERRGGEGSGRVFLRWWFDFLPNQILFVILCRFFLG